MRARHLIAIVAVLACALAGSAAARSSSKSSSHAHRHGHGPAATGIAGEFDYYVMALSWSPTFCETHPDDGDQCGSKGYGFVLHGLWPQYERGGGPEHCATTDEPDRKTVANTLAFMPSRQLVNHEWRAHGACTGLDPTAYFALADRAFAVVHAPPELAAPRAALRMTSAGLIGAFTRANTNLRDEMLSLHCSRGELAEVRVCLDKDLAPRSCGKRMPSRCPATAEFDIPASR
jgi:ribonuclease T2